MHCLPDHRVSRMLYLTKYNSDLSQLSKSEGKKNVFPADHTDLRRLRSIFS